ncbi:ABC transporter ATP-binding protein [Candidatus Sumerlaeota bacterium]|nr:ABC transporter ATP-binding protein [Candidatus Sumerlaeota bacterium]
MLRVENLTSGYGRIVALKGVSLHVNPGEMVTLIGANGSGKSTLLSTLAGLIRPMNGKVFLGNREVTRLSPEKMVRQGVALVPEGRQLFAPMSVEDNLILGAYTRRRDGQSGTLDEVFGLFPILRERRAQPAGTLSGGEQQMLAIGRALMSRPSLLLLDEPSMGLAPRIAQDIFATLSDLKRSDTSMLLVEQNAHLALRAADRGYVIETGQIVLEGDSESLRSNRDVQRAYLGRGYQEAWDA